MGNSSQVGWVGKRQRCQGSLGSPARKTTGGEGVGFLVDSLAGWLPLPVKESDLENTQYQ